MRAITRLAVCALVVLSLSGTKLSGQTALVANAGPDQSGMFVGTTVNLTGAGSTGATTFAWTFTKRPSGSTAVLVNPTSVTPSFVPDRGGLYTVRVTVGNGSTTKTDTVNITTANRAPTANAGPDLTGAVAASVTLSGLGSSDPDFNTLTYKWTLVSAPPSSLGVLTNTTKNKASLKLDRPGTYVIELVVKDGLLFSAPDQVVVTTTNSAPVARAGPDRRITLGVPVQLDGAGSWDINENPLTYAWTLTRPSGSSAVLDHPRSPLPRFTPDKAGSYTATLTVSDGLRTAKDSVVLATSANRAPVARAGLDDKALQNGQTIQLDATRSTDANGQLLDFAWSITASPSGSVAVLGNPTTPRPTFTADRTGNFTFSLVTTDPGALTASDTRLYSTALPQANAGPDQVVGLGDTATLDGSASLHLNGGLVYGWALLSKPAGSTAKLDAPGDPQPQFVADLAGVYIAQLIVFDGVKLSAADTVVVTTNDNVAPRVDLGPDRVAAVGVPVVVDASATDANGDPLTFSWALVSRPAGSAATVSPLTGSPIQITPDVAGDYVVQMIATDPGGLAGMGTLLITTGNTAPTVDAGSDRVRAVGANVALVIEASDPDNGAIVYTSRFLSVPAGSHAQLANTTTDAPSFTPDVTGVYVVQVIVRDAVRLYATDAVVIRAINGATVPTADAGAPQTVTTGDIAQLDGTGSSDPEGAPLTYLWHVVSKPVGSLAVLSSTTASEPTILIDVAGPYVFELVVNDGAQDSAPDQVTITGKAPITLSVTPKAGSIASGASTPLTVTASEIVTSPLLVQLTSSNPSLLGVPPTVTIPVGQSSANFNASGGAGTGGALVTASIPTSTAKATVAVGARLVQWTDDVSGLWSDATHWTNDIAPGVGDVVVIDRPAGNFTITVDSTTAAISTLQSTEALSVTGSLVVNGTAAIDGGLVFAGTLAGAGSAKLGSAMTWTSGFLTLAGGLDVLNGQTLTFPSNGVGRWVLNSSLTNHGTLAMGTGNGLNFQGTATVLNAAGGLWTVTGPGNIDSNGCGTYNITNAGTLRKTGGGQLSLSGCNLPYVNTGVLDIQAGTVTVPSDGKLVNSGQIAVTTGATFFLDRVTLAAGTTFAGAGQLSLNGTTTVTADVTITLPTDLTGTLTGTGTVHMNAPMTWTGGFLTLAGGLDVVATRTVTFPNNGVGRWVLNSSLTNHGTLAMGTGNSLNFQGTATVLNAAGGLWTVTGPGNIDSNGCGTYNITNAGTLRKTGVGQLSLSGCNLPYVNTGVLDLQAGTVSVPSDGKLLNSGQIAVTTGATFLLDRVTLAAGTTFAGAGLLSLNGTTTVTADVTVTLPTDLAGTLTGTGTVHMNAPMTWTNGYLTLAGGLDVVATRTLMFPNNGVGRWMINSSLTNHGTLAMGTGNGLNFQGTATVTNAAGGLWTVTGPGNIDSNGCGTYNITNAGTLRKTGGGQLSLSGCNLPYVNTGVLDLQAGTVTVPSDGKLLNSGQIAVTTGATFFLDRVTLAAGTTFAGAGQLSMNGTTTVTADVTVTLPTDFQATLTGSGTWRMDAAMTWTGGVLELAGGLEVRPNRTATFPNNGVARYVINSSLTNRGTVAMGSGNALGYQGTQSTVRNESGGLWTLTGNSALASNGGPGLPGGFTFVNAGTMQGTGNTLTVAGTISFTAGTISGITVLIQ